MKKIILATLAAAALVACAKEEVVVAPKGEAIAFNNAFVDNATKAIDPSTTIDNLQGFQVYGTTEGDHDGAQVVNIFKDVAVGYNLTAGVGENWKYAAGFTQYWIADNTYNFAAVANAAGEQVDGVWQTTSVKVNGNGMPESIEYDAESQKDLLYATYDNVVGKASGNAPIGFTFNHLLSKVKFSFKNLSAEDSNTTYTYKVTNVKVYGVRKTAVCNVADYNATSQHYSWPTNTADTWYDETSFVDFGNIVATNETATANSAAINIAPQQQGSSHYERLLIPGKYDNLTIECHIELLIGEAVVDVIEYKNTLSIGIEGGQAFNFVLTGQVGEPIQFTVTKVNEWTENERVL